jgi:hypothetical protein
MLEIGETDLTAPDRGTKSSGRAFTARAYEPGAVWELRLSVAWADVEEYLSLYATWFFGVDTSKESGRRLLTVLSPEFGGTHNLVFLFWYENRFKQDYYCKLARAFFGHHLNDDITGPELMQLYRSAARVLGKPADDTRGILTALATWQTNAMVPEAVTEAIRAVDAKFRRLVVSQESLWSFGVNPEKIQRFRRAEKEATAVDFENCGTSLLESSLLRDDP